MSYTTPVTVPQSFHAGDTVQFQFPTSDYDSTYTLEFVAVCPTKQILVNSAIIGGYHVITLTSAITSAATAGIYNYRITATQGTIKLPYKSGTLTILPNLTTATTGYDARSTVQKVVDAIEAYLAGDTTATNVAIITQSCPDFSATRTDAYALLTKWRQLLRIEQDEERVRNGEPSQRTLWATFTKV